MKRISLVALLLCLALVLASSSALAVDEPPAKEQAAQQATESETIPTLGEWALIIFSVLLVGYMAYTVVRRRTGIDYSA
ncbi:MAG: IPTL-CTERM sorting domain-containing protein [candidate division Zixibacteria bacterium]|nr:IPTL-CTERM sorting domain-containing protein [candidate division Zixibacteria bacterium]